MALLLLALRFWLDKRIQSPEQAETLLGRPLTAQFPVVRKPQVYSKVTRASRAMMEQLLNTINIEIAQAAGKPYPRSSRYSAYGRSKAKRGSPTG
ncbi:hypothetical protein [Spirosoma rhododendri]|uniref:hypothetical protein n=1 Tax=Spirosoma rhododendri TaxID=2728024 RepID=UPI0015816B6A|nr:hypothetical protein [Spirosoma rhododendri]